MVHPVRMAMIVALLVLASAPAVAQPPTAPPPHAPLDELVKEYVRLGLPLPPPDAPLVRIAFKRIDTEDPDAPRTYFSYSMGFRLPPAAPGRDPRYLIGYGRLWDGMWFDPAFVEVVQPELDSLKDVWLSRDEAIPLAIQCELRGWHKLADAVYSIGREKFAELAEMNQEPIPSLIVEMRGYALVLRERPINEPGSDRKAILARIKELVTQEPSYLTPWRKEWLAQLELTVAPPSSKPGTIEALIDDLTEYWEDRDNPSNRKGQEAYWKLAELGFDAVPALIKHLEDDRLSRAYSHPFIMCWPYSMTVGHLCTRLLLDLSARETGPGLDEPRGDRLHPIDATDWFAAARKIGEEEWLISLADPARKVGSAPFRWTGSPKPLLLHVIGAKYPGRIPELYKAILKKPHSEYGDYIEAMLSSKLTREQKIALFQEGVRSSDVEHRLDALKGLSQLDQPLFAKRLLELLMETSDRIKKGNPEAASPSAIVSLVKRSGDRQCWDALVTTTKVSPYEDRIETIREIGPDFAPDQPDPLRRERVRFLVAFLNDRTAVPDKDDDRPPAQIRDFAAYHLAALFRFPVERAFIESFYPVRFNHDLGPLSRLLLRESVRELARRELVRVK